MEFAANIQITEQDLRQFHFFHERHKKRGVFFTYVALYVLAALVLLLFRHINDTITASYAVLLGYLLLFSLLKTIKIHRQIKSLARNEKSSYIVFKETEYYVSSTHSEGRSDYSPFSMVFHWRDCWYFYRDKTHATLVPDRCFVEGEPADFGAFLREKCGLIVKEIK